MCHVNAQGTDEHMINYIIIIIIKILSQLHQHK